MTLMQIRQMLAHLAEVDYSDLHQMVQREQARLADILCSGVDPDGALLAQYCALRTRARKMLRCDSGGSYRYMFAPGNAERVLETIHCLVLDTARSEILLQRRGPFKRLFPGKRTVSAVAKPRDQEAWRQAVALAVRAEVGIATRPGGFVVVGRPARFCGKIVSFDFWALSSVEAQLLQHVTAQLSMPSPTDAVLADYSAPKRSLCIFSVADSVSRDQVLALANQVQERTGVPPIFPGVSRSRNTLVVYQLTEQQRMQILTTNRRRHQLAADARRRLRSPLSPKELDRCVELIDADTMEFISWPTLLRAYTVQPLDCALDVLGLYLKPETRWVWDQLTLLASSTRSP